MHTHTHKLYKSNHKEISQFIQKYQGQRKDRNYCKEAINETIGKFFEILKKVWELNKDYFPYFDDHIVYITVCISLFVRITLK